MRSPVFSTNSFTTSHLFGKVYRYALLCLVYLKKMKSRLFKISIHIIGWCLLIFVPFFSTQQVYQNVLSTSGIISYVPVFVVSTILISNFYFNYFYLIPKYLFNQKYWQYFSLLLVAILSTSFLSGLIFQVADLNIHKIAETNPVIESIKPVIRLNGVLLLIVAIVTSTLLAVNNRLKETEKEKLSAQIASLKSQINPHFLFNTLNNIYATAINSSEKTADMVEKLSEMMRYTMKDTQKDMVSLEDEINYIDNYIELQKVRLDKSVKLEYDYNGDFYDYEIAPMLLIPFIENAFKHGVNAEQCSHIRIEISLKEDELHLTVSNRKVDIQSETAERSGLGIENTKHRLQLLYPSKHLLSIKETERDFLVSLHINLL